MQTEFQFHTQSLEDGQVAVTLRVSDDKELLSWLGELVMTRMQWELLATVLTEGQHYFQDGEVVVLPDALPGEQEAFTEGV